MIGIALRRGIAGVLFATAVGAVAATPGWAQTGSGGTGSGGTGSASGSGSLSASGSAALPISSSNGLGALAAATSQTGKMYEWGATGPDTWDCSGLVQWAFRQVGVVLPRTTWEQAEVGASVPRYALSPGDVIIINQDASHVGIYAGFGQVLNAYAAGFPVGLTPLDQFYIYSIRRF
ncbi:NlpC/P60 family protein [Nocardia sp. NPDC003963]